MGIEVTGGKHAYAVVYHGAATKQDGLTVHTHHNYAHHVLVADSADEAFGRATRLARRIFPSLNGWTYTHPTVVQIDDIDTAVRVDEFDVKPFPCPFEK